MPGPKYTEGLPPLQPIIDSLVAHSGVTLLVLVVLVMLMLATLVSVGVRLRRMERLWRKASQSAGDAANADMLLSTAERTADLLHRMATAEGRLEHLTSLVRGCVQHVGMVRYDAFEDVGGNQSFSLALLDGRHTGVVITGIYSRTDVRFYAKHMESGQPSVPLTPEEIAAVNQATTGAQS